MQKETSEQMVHTSTKCTTCKRVDGFVNTGKVSYNSQIKYLLWLKSFLYVMSTTAVNKMTVISDL